MTLKVAVGIPTYNGAERLGWLLKSISMRTPEIEAGEAQIVIVDDGSPRREETRAKIREWEGRLPIKYIEHEGNRGISAGWNTCSRATDAPLVCLINDDVIIAKGWLRALTHVLDHSPSEAPGIGAVSAAIHWFTREDADALTASPDSDRDVIPRDHTPEHRHAPDRRQLYEDCNPGRIMCPMGALFAFRRKDFDMVGGFDERMKACFEESMFGTELAARGLITAHVSWPHAYHMWSATLSANPELQAAERANAGRLIYRERWGIPGHIGAGQEFSFTNPKFMSAIGDVPIEWVRKSGEIEKGVLRTDGAYVKS